MTRLSIYLILISIPAGVLAQTTRRVSLDGSADFTDIQSAIDTAADGDTILVAPGEYIITEPINFNRLHDPENPGSPPVKNIEVRSEAGADETIVRMSETPIDSAGASLVVFENGEDEDSVLRGLTLTGSSRAGVLFEGAVSPFVEECVIEENSSLVDLGAGVCCTQNASPTLQSCRILNNHAASWEKGYGGGVYCGSASLLLVDCEIRGNHAARSGGGLWCSNGSVTLDNCTIVANAAGTYGGVGMGSSDGISSEGRVTLRGCVVAGNSDAEDFGGALGGSNLSNFTIERCTIVGNSATAVRLAADSLSVIRNSIIWANTRDSISQPVSRSELAIEFSCIESDSVWPGEGNINQDPLFCLVGRWDDNSTPKDSSDDFWIAGDYSLREGSPCIATGEGGSNMGADLGSCELGSRPFIRGNANAQGAVDMADAVFTLSYLFLGETAPGCLDAVDTNDDGSLDISDAVAVLFFSFLGELRPVSPFPGCGADDTADGLGCVSFPTCGR